MLVRVALLAVAMLVAAPLVQALPVVDGDMAFAFGRDTTNNVYVLVPGNAGDYEVGSWGNGNIYAVNGREWAFGLVDLENPAFSLDSGGTLEVSLAVGGGSGERGVATVNWELKHEGTQVAVGEGKRIEYLEETKTTTWSVAAPDITVEQGDSLVFRVFTSQHVSAGSRMTLDSSSLTMPVVDAVAPPTPVFWGNATESGAVLSLVDAATAIYHYNLTSELSAANVTLLADVGQGTLGLAVLDGAGEMLFNETVTESGDHLFSVPSAVPGPWRLSFYATDFLGNATVVVAPLIAATGENPQETVDEEPDAEDTQDDDHDDNATVDDAPDDKESPALPLIAVPLVLAALLRRQR